VDIVCIEMLAMKYWK